MTEHQFEDVSVTWWPRFGVSNPAARFKVGATYLHHTRNRAEAADLRDFWTERRAVAPSGLLEALCFVLDRYDEDARTKPRGAP